MATPPAFIGMRGSGDWVNNQRPEDWREMILYLFPNGDAPLTAILSKMATKVTMDPTFNWWTQQLPLQAADTINSGIYTDSNLSNAYVSGGTTGDFVYANIAEADMDQFRIGHQITMRDSSDLSADVVGKCVDRSKNGTSSYLKIKLLEDDDNSTGSNDLSDCDRVLVSGNSNAEGAGMPDAISYDPTQWFNSPRFSERRWKSLVLLWKLSFGPTLRLIRNFRKKLCRITPLKWNVLSGGVFPAIPLVTMVNLKEQPWESFLPFVVGILDMGVPLGS